MNSAGIGVWNERDAAQRMAAEVESHRAKESEAPVKSRPVPDQLAAEYLAGDGIKELAERHEMPCSTIQRQLIRHGVQMRKKGHHPVRDEPQSELAKAYESGLSVWDLAKQEGVSVTTIRRWLAKEGVQMRKHGGSRPRGKAAP